MRKPSRFYQDSQYIQARDHLTQETPQQHVHKELEHEQDLRKTPQILCSSGLSKVNNVLGLQTNRKEIALPSQKMQTTNKYKYQGGKKKRMQNFKILSKIL